MINILLNGFATGLLLQLAIGPVSFFILNLTLQGTLLDGLSAVLAVTLVDYLYITLAILGVGRLLSKPRTKHWAGIIGAAVLAAFGIVMIVSTAKSSVGAAVAVGTPVSNYLSSFLSAFVLTASSPLTIVFWTSLFSAKAVEKGYSTRQLVPFALAAGLSTLFFLSAWVAVFSLIKASIPLMVIRLLNIIVGGLFVLYGIVRLARSFRPVPSLGGKVAPAACRRPFSTTNGNGAIGSRRTMNGSGKSGWSSRKARPKDRP